jgi:hypothetical protein
MSDLKLNKIKEWAKFKFFNDSLEQPEKNIDKLLKIIVLIDVIVLSLVFSLFLLAIVDLYPSAMKLGVEVMIFSVIINLVIAAIEYSNNLKIRSLNTMIRVGLWLLVILQIKLAIMFSSL